MNGFRDREKGFERKYQVDEETRFKIIARRNRLLGAWAAERMGLAGVDADGYAKEVVAADFERPGDDDVIEKVLKDFAEKGVDLGESDIRKKMDELTVLARDQIAGPQT